MRRAILIHWRPEEAADGLSAIRDTGWQVELFTPQGGNLKPLRDAAPDALVIDLSRLPSHGREVAEALVRRMPVVFAGGAPDKVDAVKARVPGATFCPWSEIAEALAGCSVADLSAVRAARPSATGYSGTPLAKKLGIKPASSLTVLNAPQGFLKRLALPEGVTAKETAAEGERVLLFVRDTTAMRKGFAKAAGCVTNGGGLTVCWPKKTSGIETDIDGNFVREYGIAQGWVDHKVCAVDETWSALLFAPQRKIGQRLE